MLRAEDPDPLPRPIAWLSVGAFVIAAAAYVAWLIAVSRLWYFHLIEDWLIFVERPDPTVAAWLEPLNGHLYAFTVIVHQVMLRLAGLESYLPWLLLQTGVHIGCAAALALNVHRYAGPIAGAIAGIVLLLLGAAYEDLYWLAQLGFIAPTALALVALYLGETVPWDRRRWLAIAGLAVAMVLYSGVGLIMLIVIAVAHLGSRRALVIVPAALVWGVWAVVWPSGYLHQGQGDPIAFAMSAFAQVSAAFFGAGISSAMVVLLLALGGGALLMTGWRPHRLTIAATAGVVALYLGVGVRADWLPEFAVPSRYLYPAAALVLLGSGPIVGAVPRFAQLGLAAIAVAVVVTNIAALQRSAVGWERSSLFFRAQSDVVEAWGRPSDARIEPYGPDAAGYLKATDRFGRPGRSPELDARLTRPEMVQVANEMRRRLEAAD